MNIDIVGFTGARHGLTDQQRPAIAECLRVLAAKGAHGFVHGCGIGADSEVSFGADALGYHIVGLPGPSGAMRGVCAYHELREPEPYLTRNRKIVHRCDVLLAAPRTCEEPTDRPGGTWYTVRYARIQAKPLFIFYPDGRVRSEIIMPGFALLWRDAA